MDSTQNHTLKRRSLGNGFALLGCVAIFLLMLSYVGSFGLGGPTSMAGRALMMGVVMSMVLLVLGLFANRISLGREEIKIVAAFLLLFSVYMLGWMVEGYSSQGGVRSMQVILVMAVAFFLMLVFRDTRALSYWHWFAVVAAGCVVASLAAYGALGRPDRFAWPFSNPNTLGTASLVAVGICGVAFAMQRRRLERRLWAIALFLAFVLAFISGSRASVLAIIIMMGAYVTWPILTRTKAFHSLAFVSIFVAPTLGLYLLIAETGVLVEYVHQLSQAVFDNARLFSARDLLWVAVLERIVEKPILGWGPGIQTSDVTRWTFSIHNLYLQVFLQVGVVGLLSLLLVLYYVWKAMWWGRNNPVVRMCGAFSIAVLIHQFFEITLTQNNLVFGLTKWMILAVGVGLSLGQKHEDEAKERALDKEQMA